MRTESLLKIGEERLTHLSDRCIHFFAQGDIETSRFLYDEGKLLAEALDKGEDFFFAPNMIPNALVEDRLKYLSGRFEYFLNRGDMHNARLFYEKGKSLVDTLDKGGTFLFASDLKDAFDSSN